MDLATEVHGCTGIGKRAFIPFGGTCTMLRSMWSGVSGLKTHQLEMDVIGNNIANVNTTAFKSQDTGFKDILYQTVRDGAGAGQNTATTNVSQVGLGAKMGSIYTNISTQGSAITTNSVYDLMITGDSFFQVSPDGGQTINYTRDGSFTVDADGYLVTKEGYYVLGAVGDDLPAGQSKKLQIIKTAMIPDETGTIGKRIHDTVDGEATEEAYLKGNINKDDELLSSSEGRKLYLEIFGDDGNTYTLKFKITDDGDTKDNTYNIRIEGITDSEGNKVKNTYGDESLTLVYNKHDGTLEDIIPNTFYTFTQTGQETDASGNVTGTSFAYYEKIRTLTQTETITGKDGEKYEVTFDIDKSNDPLADYDFSLKSIKKLTGSGAGKTVEYENQTITLKYDDISGDLVLVAGAVSTDFAISVQEDGFDIGDLYFDFSQSSKIIQEGTGYNFNFAGDAGEKLGEFLHVDFANTTNYADTNGRKSSTLYAYKGDQEGQFKGYAKGDLTGISFGTDGSIYGTYSNGQTIKKGHISVAIFNNPMGLVKTGDNLYAASPNSGDATVQDITKDGGYMNSGVLEGSNVDLAREFTNMITTQRGFQANSKVITTSDEMLQILKGLKR